MENPKLPPSGPSERVALDEALTIDARHLVSMALREDIGPGDLTSAVCLGDDAVGRAEIVARQDGVLAGLWVADLVYGVLGGEVTVEARAADGESFAPGDVLATVSGPVRTILAGERTVLNFLQRLSGVTTLTRTFVDRVFGTVATICDTRKTTPGWRRLEKYAVRCGGGTNHRMGLYDEVLIKDNHIALAGEAMATLVGRAREQVGDGTVIEVEVDTLEQLETVLPLPVDIVLLDNMTCDQMRQAVVARDARSSDGKPLLEASGGITLETVRGVAETGVDRISVGAITHSAAAVDIGMDIHTL
jgi:nicotinate-nucleotide pyrophosphorylase (carboxylating)